MEAHTYKELDESIYDLLELIRKRPGVLIGEPSIYRLDSMLGGCTAGLGRFRFKLRDGEDFHRFQDWVAWRLGYFESTLGWADMIREKSANDEEAFSKFYDLLDEFRRE